MLWRPSGETLGSTITVRSRREQACILVCCFCAIQMGSLLKGEKEVEYALLGD